MAHDCGHLCCDERHDPLHDHFLSPSDCPPCGARRAQMPPAEVMAWLHETYKPEGVEIWLASWRKADPERRAFLERLAHMDSMGT